MKFFLERNGAVSVFLAIIMVPVIVISCLFVDASRAQMAGGLVYSAGDLTLNTALTRYDEILNDYYGLLASAQDVDTFLGTAEEYFTDCISVHNVDQTDARRYAKMLVSLLKDNSGEVADLLKLSTSDGGKFNITPVGGGNLENPAMVKKEIVEFMKYRAPADIAADLLDKFKKCTDSLKNADKDAKLEEDKKKAFEEEGELMKEAKNAYDAIRDYENVGITKEMIDDIRDTLSNAKGTYENAHGRLVRDLYNTDGLSFTAGNIESNPQIDESKIRENQFAIYAKNAAIAMKDFIAAAKTLEHTRNTMPKFSNSHYPIQYWRAYDEAIKSDGNSYQKFVNAANKLANNVKKMQYCYDNLLTDEEKEETITVDYYQGINISGTHSCAEYYDELTRQKDSLWSTEINNNNCAYIYITETLSGTSDENKHLLNKTTVNDDIKKIHDKVDEFYKKIDEADKKLKEANKKLAKVKSKAREYRQAFEKWENNANSYSSTMSKEDRKEIKDYDQEVMKKLSDEEIDKLTKRINDVRSLLGNVKRAIEECKYNGKSIRKIDGFKALKSASGVDANRITFENGSLNSYVKESFHFTTPDNLGATNVTDNNNPVLSVNAPPLYTWLVNKFKNYNENEKKNGENRKNDQESKYDEQLNDDDNTKGNEHKSGDIKKQYGGDGSLPSGNREEPSAGDIVSRDLTKIAGFVSGLFTNFGDTLKGTAVNARDDIYAIDYIMNMFSYDTFDNEGKFHLCDDNSVSLKNHDNKYKAVESKWANTDLTFTENKTLTNKMINGTNNFANGAEVEYILYGGTNNANVAEAYAWIFAIRFVLNMPAQFQEHWNNCTELEILAEGVQGATCGIVPAALVKFVAIIGLTAGESVLDLTYLRAGLPVKLVKAKDDLAVKFSAEAIADPKTDDTVSDRTVDVFFYSDYLKLFLFLGLSAGDEYGIYARTMDVIQANMRHIEKGNPGFLASKSYVYYKAEGVVRVEPLMMDLTLVNNAGYSLENGSWNTITYSQYKGY